jgi:DNA-nicking Smr family endonuclease
VNKNFACHTKPQRRRLSTAELELWLDATQSVDPKTKTRSPPAPAAKIDSELHPRETARRPPKGPELAGASKQAPPKLPPPLAPIERRLRQKLSRGRVAPDAEIDLHGMHLREAFSALRAFLSHAQNDGARLVLVVTGKGKRAASADFTPGILRKSVPNWLRGAEFHTIVLGFEQAARPHGGSGALYVRLKKAAASQQQRS